MVTKMSENYLPAGTLLKSPLQSYRIEEVLGSGGFGITYRATTKSKFGNITTKFSVAIKEHFLSADCQRGTDSKVVYSKPAATRVERARKDFISEANRLSAVGNSHPNIVKVNEVFEANNTAYYVMEYLDGSTLRKYVEQVGKLDELEALSLIQPIIEAIGTLHTRQITHLDIKPDNIMLRKGDDGKFVPVLIDFGLSKHYDSEGKPTSTINVAGYSPGFAPIEQMLAGGVKSFSPVSDIYSLAATLYFCLSGKIPAEPTSETDSPLEGALAGLCSPKVAEALLNATQNKRNLRPQSAVELLDQLGLKPSQDFENALKSIAVDSDETKIVGADRKNKVSDTERVSHADQVKRKFETFETKKLEKVEDLDIKHHQHVSSKKTVIMVILALVLAVIAYFVYDKYISGDIDTQEEGTQIGEKGNLEPDINAWIITDISRLNERDLRLS